jgi:hypothetical protein
MIHNLEHLKRMLYAWVKSENRPEVKDKVWYCIYLLENGLAEAEEIIVQAKNIGSRNPDFPGDWIGRPDDDFDD